MQQVSNYAIYREMDAEELKEEFLKLKDMYPLNLDILKYLRKQYRQLTGKFLFYIFAGKPHKTFE